MWVSVNGGVSGVGQEAERDDYYHIVKYLQLSLSVVEYIFLAGQPTVMEEMQIEMASTSGWPL